MDERRKDVRDKVIYGGVAAADQNTTTDCIVRNLSEHGARIEFKSGVRPPQDRMALTIARKGCSFAARVIWKRDNIIGIAFTEPAQATPATSDIEERLRKSELKKRQLQRQIKTLLNDD